MLYRLLYSPFLFVLFLFTACEAVENPDGGVLPYQGPTAEGQAKIVLNNLVYTGYQTPAIVIVQDNNNTNQFLDLEVSGLADPIGITLRLSNSGTNFIGLLWFTNSNSVAGSTIKTTNSDQLRFVYDEVEPDGKRIKFTQWFSKFIYPIYEASPHVLEFGVNPDYGDLDQTEHLTGGDVNYYLPSALGMSIHVMSNAWRSYRLKNPINLGVFTGGYLAMRVQASNNIEIKLEWSDYVAAASVRIADYITLGTNVHNIKIPLSDFVGLDLVQFRGFTFAWYGLQQATFGLSEVRLEK